MIVKAVFVCLEYEVFSNTHYFLLHFLKEQSC